MPRVFHLMTINHFNEPKTIFRYTRYVLYLSICSNLIN